MVPKPPTSPEKKKPIPKTTRTEDIEKAKQLKKNSDESQNKLHPKHIVQRKVQEAFDSSESFRDVKSVRVFTILKENLGITGKFQDIDEEDALKLKISKPRKVIKEIIKMDNAELKEKWKRVAQLLNKDEWNYPNVQDDANKYKEQLLKFYFQIPNEFYGNIKTYIIAFISAVGIRSQELEIRNAKKQGSASTHQHSSSGRQSHQGFQRPQYHQSQDYYRRQQEQYDEYQDLYGEYQEQRQRQRQRKPSYHEQFQQYQRRPDPNREPKRQDYASYGAYQFAHNQWVREQRVKKQQEYNKRQEEKRRRQAQAQYQAQQQRFHQSRTSGHQQTGYVSLDQTYRFLMGLSRMERSTALLEMSRSDPDRRKKILHYYGI